MFLPKKINNLNLKNNNNKEVEGNLGGDEYVYSLDGGDGFMGMYLCPHSASYIDYAQLFTC